MANRLQHAGYPLLAVGDIMMGVCALPYAPPRYQIPCVLKSGREVCRKSIYDLFGRHTVRIGNLEGLLTRQNLSYRAKNFIGPAEGAACLRQLGFDILSLANNHVPDYPEDYVVETKSLLAGVGISCLHSPEMGDDVVFRRVQGRKVAFIGYGLKPYFNCETDNLDDPDNYRNLDLYVSRLATLAWDSQVDPLSAGNVIPLLRTIKRVQDQGADALVVYMHWGYAGTFFPSPFQVAIAHLLVDRGVDILLGTHPHVIQPLEVYRGKLIVYSLGNFLFDMWKTARRKSLIVSADLETVIRWECFLSTHRYDGNVDVSDQPVAMEKIAVKMGDCACDFRVVPEYARYLAGMEETMNDPTKYFRYRQHCWMQRSLPEFLCSRLPLEVKLKCVCRRIGRRGRA
jgi:poly-gamma-glutamate capsule biosynthesis protein CapA/YwtB (metallophosphatase superfamily)